MKFNSETGRAAGKKSRRGKSYDVQEIRQRFQELIEGNLDQLNSDLQELEPKDRINSIIKLARFVMPTLKAVEVDGIPEPMEIPIFLTDKEAEAYEERIKDANLPIKLKRR